MFKKLLNVGKGHSNEQQRLQQQQQQQQKNLFQLNEIRSYGFSHLCCLGYSASLSLLAVGSKTGLLRVLGNPSVEFNYQFGSTNSIRQIEFIDCRDLSTQSITNGNGGNKQNKKSQDAQLKQEKQNLTGATAKIVVLTDNGQLHLLELITVKQSTFTDNTTQTDIVNSSNNCCQVQSNQKQQHRQEQQDDTYQQRQDNVPEYTKLVYVGHLDYFIFKFDDEDRSKRVTTLEISASGSLVFVGTEGGNVYQVPLDKFEQSDGCDQLHQQNQNLAQADVVTGSVQRETGIRQILDDVKEVDTNDKTRQANSNNVDDDIATAMNLNDEPQIEQGDADIEPFEMIKFEEDVGARLGDEIKPKKQGAVESIQKHPTSNDKILLSYHRGLSIIYDVKEKQVDKYFYHNQILESSCFAGQNGDYFYTSHNDGSYIKWNVKKGTQSKADDDFIGQLYGPYPCKPTPKIQACSSLLNDQLEDLIIFSGGMPRATYDDKNPITIVRGGADGKDTIKVVLDFTSKILDFVVITRPRGSLGMVAKSTSSGGGGGKRGKNKQQQQQQQQRNQQIAVALAILADEEFVVIDLLNSESYLEFSLPYLNCVQPSAITCNQHYSDISNDLYEQLLDYNRQHVKGKLSQNEWPIQGGKVINTPDIKSHDILITGHEDGSVNMWDVSDFAMRHLLHVPTAKYFTTEDDELAPIDEVTLQNGKDDDTTQTDDASKEASSAWPPLKRVGRFDPFSDDTRLAIRKISLCPRSGTLLVAGTGGQVLVFELSNKSNDTLTPIAPDEVTIVSDQRFTWKGREKLSPKLVASKSEPGYQLISHVQLNPPASITSSDLRSDWHLFAVGTQYGFVLYDYASRYAVVNRCTLNVQDFAIVSGDAGAMSRKKSFRKSLRESFRRLRRGRSQRNQPVSPDQPSASDQPTVVRKQFGRATTGVRTLQAPVASNDTVQQAAAAHRNLFSGERQVEVKVELSSIVKCITLTSALITNNLNLFKPSLWVGTNSGQVLVYAIDLSSEQDQATSPSSGTTTVTESSSEQTPPDSSSSDVPKTVAKLTKEIQLKHKAPIIAIFTSPEAPQQHSLTNVSNESATISAKSTPEKNASSLFQSTDSSQTGRSSIDRVAGDQQNVSSTGVALNEPEASGAADQQRAQTPSMLGDKSPSKSVAKDQQQQQQPRVLICSEEQFKVFNLPNFKPFCKFKLTAHEGLRAKKISITQFIKPPQISSTKSQLLVASTSSAPLSASKLLSTTTLNSSKSLQSFATQTSPPASPVPQAVVEASVEVVATSSSSSAQAIDESAKQANSANGVTTGVVNKATESNNNSLLAPNNNNLTSGRQQQDKDLLNAKFGAKANSTTTSQTNVDRSVALDEQNAECNATFEPYMVCMSNQGDCAIYSVPDLKRQAQIQVCKREDVNGITSAILTNYGEGYYLRSSSNFLRFSISSHRVMRILSVV